MDSKKSMPIDDEQKKILTRRPVSETINKNKKSN